MIRKPYLTRQEVQKQFPDGSWQHAVFTEFVASLESSSRPFPCIFGIQGLRTDSLRYTFLGEVDVPRLGCALARFLSEARTFGPYTSLVAFTRPELVYAVEHYRNMFWSILDALARIDSKPWPAAIPRTLDDPAWEFCFAGEPVFVVCNTPAHIARQSRHSSSFMLSFQPRWVFANTLSNDKAAQAATAKVRARLLLHDALPPSPDLGLYGHPENREYKQYFLDDANGPTTCPYTELGVAQAEKI